jgi:trimethylamine--corrinoid protein Co-methyltransferase
MPTSTTALGDMRRMASLAMGGEATFEERPNLIVYAEPVSPMSHPDESIRKLLYCAEHRLPVAYVPFAARGGTAPIGQAAIIAQLTAESLSALVIHQAKRPGAPFIFGGMASIMDMSTTVFSYGAPEFQAGNTMMAEMAHYLDLPNFGTGGTSDSQVLDGQALIEASTSCMLAHLCGAHLVHDIGLLGSATILMPEMIVISDHLAAKFKAMFREVQTDPDSLATERFSCGISSGEFISTPETLAHFREIWYPPLFYRGGARRWEKESDLTFEEQANQLTRKLIEQPPGNCLPAQTAEPILQILRDAETSQ